jgi:hypothetical protein
MKIRIVLARLSVGAVALAVAPQLASAQEQRLVGRLPDAVRVEVDSILNTARSRGLPVEPLVDRALEGAAKGAPGEGILRAVRRLTEELTIARAAFGDSALPSELAAGASALRAGAVREDLVLLREARSGQPLTVAAGVLADLVAVGVPTDTAIAAVLALAGGLDDAQYLAFRANVERDIALGALPSAALGVRLDGFDGLLEVSSPASVDGLGSSAGRNPPSPTKRKP